MKRLVHNASVALRRLVHAVVLRVPQGLRTMLSKSRLLTSAFVYFDNARYEPVLEPGGYEAWRAGGRKRVNAVPLSLYRYRPPKFTGEERSLMAAWEYLPLVSVIMPVFDTTPRDLKRAIESVRGQWYPRWELCIVDDCSTRADTRAVLESLRDPRISVQFLARNHNIAGASNQALEQATGDFIALLDHDDELTPDALFEVVNAVNRETTDFIYSDEDKLTPGGTFIEPHFKQDFAPDTLLSQNYISHLAVMRRSLVERAGGFTPGLEGAQDYDLYLKVLELTDRITHIPKVLYHWRQAAGSTAGDFDGKSYVQDAGLRALRAAVLRRGLAATVENGLHEGTYRVRYGVSPRPLVSIVIPFRDQPELLDTCLSAILRKSTYSNYEILGVSNNSEDARTFALMEKLAARHDSISFHEFNRPFNFSAINNHAVNTIARGEHVVLLNNDIEIITPDWIESLLEHSQREEVGAVGAKLYYPSGEIQHAGIVLGIGGLAGHSHKLVAGDSPGYFARLQIAQNVAAVTGACLMVKKRLYEEVGGLDAAHLKIAFNDVDFCLRLLEKGLVNVFTPYCEAYHHESISRGYEDTVEKQRRFSGEVEYSLRRHAAVIEAGDPYYNPNLTLDREDFSLKASRQGSPRS